MPLDELDDAVDETLLGAGILVDVLSATGGKPAGGPSAAGLPWPSVFVVLICGWLT